MEQAVKGGKVRSIGISNFEFSNLEDIMNAAVIKPVFYRWNAIHTGNRRNLKKE